MPGYMDDPNNSGSYADRGGYNSEGDTTADSINLAHLEQTHRVFHEDGTIEITDTLPKKEYYMSLRRGPPHHPSVGTLRGGMAAGGSSAYDSGTLRTLNRSEASLDFKPSGKTMECLVVMLDGTEEVFTIDKASFGQQLFEAVCEHLALTEMDYFGITFRDTTNVWFWLACDKKISKQLGKSKWVFEFQVKFYPPNLESLQEELTRYYISLQVRQDIVSGQLPCSFPTYVLLGAYVVQSEAGDHDPNMHIGTDYLKDQPFSPQHLQNYEMLDKIRELHKLNKGQSPEEADRCFMDNARKLAMYGVDLHKCKSTSGEDVSVGVYHGGIVVYRGRLRINRFSWPKIIKLSYKNKAFHLTVRPIDGSHTESLVIFKCKEDKLARRLWKACVEHHAFFRLRQWDAPRKPNLLPGFATRKYTLTQQRSGSISSPPQQPAPRPQPRFKRVPTQRKASTDGWFTLQGNGQARGMPPSADGDVCAPLSPTEQYNREYTRPGFDLEHWRMSPADCSQGLGMDVEGLDLAAQHDAGWQGCRSNKGVKAPGQYYYEGTLLEDGVVLLGWSTNDASLELGADTDGFALGFGSSGRSRPPPGSGGNPLPASENLIPIKTGDVMGCHVDLDAGSMQWSRNGDMVGSQMPVPQQLLQQPFFPAATLHDARVKFNFGDQPFLFYPTAPWIPASQSSDENQVSNKHAGWRMNPYDTSKMIDIAPDGLGAQAQLSRGWQGCRSNKGVFGGGKYYYEATPIEANGVSRVGWATQEGQLDLGTDQYGFGYGADREGFGPDGLQGRLMHCDQPSSHGESYVKDDIIGCLIDLDQGTLVWTKNGQAMGSPVNIPAELVDKTFFPVASLNESTMEFNFGDKPFKYYPGDEWQPLSYTPDGNTRQARRRGPERKIKGLSYMDPSALEEALKQKMFLNSQHHGGQPRVAADQRPVCPVSPVNGSDQYMQGYSPQQHVVNGNAKETSVCSFPSIVEVVGGEAASQPLCGEVIELQVPLDTGYTITHEQTASFGGAGAGACSLPAVVEHDELTMSGTNEESPLPYYGSPENHNPYYYHQQQYSSSPVNRDCGPYSPLHPGSPYALNADMDYLQPLKGMGPGAFSYLGPTSPQPAPLSPSAVFLKSHSNQSNNQEEQQATKTVEHGDPIIETETYYDAEGNLVTRTVRRTKVTTKTTTNRVVTERSENEIMAGKPAKKILKHTVSTRVTDADDDDDRALMAAIYAVTGMDPDISVLNDTVGDVEIKTQK